jgi:CheY-like chemotaxis protein
VRILIVEDDTFKLVAICDALCGLGNAQISVAKSLRTAMTELEDHVFDFVVLDMAIPSHTSDVGAVDTYSQPVGGLDVLLFLESAGRLERIAILTQHPTVEYDRRHVPLKDLVKTLNIDGITNVAGAILFTETGDWKAPLLQAMEGLR